MDVTRLKGILLQSGVKRQNDALFQVIDQLIDSIAKVGSSTSTTIVAPASQSSILTSSGMSGIDGIDGEDGFPLPGPQGIQGVQGQIGPSGSVFVLADDGQDTDFIPPIVGPQGNPGPTGSQGPIGQSVVMEDIIYSDDLFPIIAPVSRNIAQTLETTVYTITGAFADITNLTVTITPRFGNSKFRITGCVNIYLGNGLAAVSCRLMRNGISIQQYDTVAFNNNLQVTGATAWTFDYIDTPATLSAITYKVQAKNTQGGSVINNIINGPDLVISSITVEEIYV